MKNGTLTLGSFLIVISLFTLFVGSIERNGKVENLQFVQQLNDYENMDLNNEFEAELVAAFKQLHQVLDDKVQLIREFNEEMQQKDVALHDRKANAGDFQEIDVISDKNVPQNFIEEDLQQTETANTQGSNIHTGVGWRF